MQSGTVKLGLMPPLSGLVGLYGKEITHAAQIACSEINENGGVLGNKLELIIEDDGSLPDSAVVAAKKLINEHKCCAIIGNLLSNSRIAVAYQVAEPSKIPYLNFSFYEGSILSRYFFHFAALPNQQIHRMIPYMQKNFGPKMFFAGNNYEWPRGSIDAGKIALLQNGGEIVGEEYLPIGVELKDIDKLLDQVEAAKPDVFVPYFAGDDQVVLLTRFTERGMKKRIAVVMGHYDEMMASTLPPKVREGYYSSNTYFMTIDSPENHSYLKKLEELKDIEGIWPKGNGILTNFGEGTYLCVKAFAQAANKAGSIESEKLIDVLKSIEVISPQGKVTMNSEHQHATVNTYLSHCDSEGVFSIIKDFGAIDPELPERYKHQRIADHATMGEDIRLQARMLEQLTEAVILISSENGSILYVNSGAETTFGYEKGDMVGLNVSNIMSADGNGSENISSKIINILNSKGKWEGEIKTVKKDGTTIWCWAVVSTFTHPVHGEVWLSVYRDITSNKISEQALRESEARYRRTERGTNDGLWEWHIPTGINYYSPRWMGMLGYEVGELPDKVDTFAELIHPDDKEEVWEAVNKHLKNGDVYDVEMRLRCKDGSYMWVRSRGETEFDNQNNPTIMSGSIVDISQRKNYETELKRHRENLEELVKERTADLEAARDIAEKASKEKNNFLSRMSHELRTPMNAILGFAQILNLEKISSKQKEFVNEILMGGEHLLNLINDLLDLSRIESGKIEVSMQPVNIKESVEHALKSVYPIVNQMGLTTKNACNDDATILADPTRFNQILINLLSNAAKYNNRNGEIEVFYEPVEQDKIRISVKDTGKGIDSGNVIHLFEPFNRLGAEKSDVDGTGIGLTLTKQLVSLMGGEIFVESTVGQGSTFSIELAATNEYINSSQQINFHQKHIPGSKQTILYIEDNKANLRIVEVFFEQFQNIQLVKAFNGEDGVLKAKSYLPDLILLDLHLPKMDGYEVLENLLDYEYTKDIPVIALTADAMPLEIERGLAAGFKEYVTKPIDLIKLMVSINKTLSADKILKYENIH